MAAGGLASALMAGANFGTGYLQGQQQDQQNQYARKMQALAIDDAALNFKQKQLSVQQQQNLSDRAMELFNPMVPGGGLNAPPVMQGQQPPTGGPTPPGQVPPADLSQVGQQQSIDPVEKLDQLASSVAGTGDIVHASELWTQAANLRAAKVEAQAKQSATQLADLKRQQIGHSLVAQTMGAATDENSWNAAKMQVLSSPWTSPEEAKNLANLPYSPDIVQRLRDTGMTSAQQAKAKMDELEQAERERHNRALEEARERSNTIRDEHNKATEQQKVKQEKVGAAKAPTEAELATATAATKDAMGGDTVDTTDPDFLRARASIASRAAQIVRDNKAVTYAQATNMAAAEAKKNGEFTQVIVPGEHFWDSDTTKQSFKPKGDTPETAMQFTGQAKSELVPGKFYQTANGLMQFTGTGWKPQK